MKRILVIDDDVDLSDTIKSVFGYKGYQVLLSHKAQEGIETAKQHKPDLIIMDIMLPEMNGAEAVKALRTEPGLKETPVIFLTGLVSKADHLDGLQIDGQHYQTLAKPFENERLLEVVKSILG